MDAMQYNITVRKGIFDGETCFEARVAELPDVAEYGDTYEEAYELALDSIETTAEIFSEKGKKMPAPIVSAEDFSGRVTLRLAKTLHRSLASAADQEGVSLNQHMVNVLSYYSGYCQGQVSIQQTRGYWETSVNYKAPTKSGSGPKLRVVSTSSPQQKVGYS